MSEITYQTTLSEKFIEFSVIYFHAENIFVICCQSCTLLMYLSWFLLSKVITS